MGGKVDKWFRGLLGLRNSASPQSPPSRSRKENRRWSCVKSYREKDDEDHHHHNAAKLGRSKTEVAAATKAAVAVVRLTRSRRSGNVKSASYGGESYWLRREWWAAVKLQSAFRGYLARKALRALKGLVRLQALVRGHIERKRTTQWLLRMQALLRAQAKAIAGRSQFSGPAHFNSKDPTAHQTSMSPLRPSRDLKEAQFYNNSPKFISRGPLTPSKSDGSRSHLSGYSDQNPNYMSYTESSKAKLRSLSAPKQRLNFHRSGSKKRNSVHEFGESRSSSLHVDFMGRVDYTAWNACRI